MTTLFLFAHQDDEIGVFHEIVKTVRLGKPLRCIYLTNGAWDGISPAKRNAETIKALTSIGVNHQDIIFLGERLGINDGKLPEHLEKIHNGLLTITESIKIGRIIIQSWEGGHQDHDGVHLSGLALAKHLGILEKTYQFPLYRMPAGRFLLSFAAPLAQNGTVIKTPASWRQRARHLLMLRHYRSQARVMLKIGSHLLWYNLVDGAAKLQPVSLERVLHRPNSGIMLYEYWKLYSEKKFRQKTALFTKKFIISEPVKDAR